VAIPLVLAQKSVVPAKAPAGMTSVMGIEAEATWRDRKVLPARKQRARARAVARAEARAEARATDI
jgi:hypothetical protein